MSVEPLTPDWPDLVLKVYPIDYILGRDVDLLSHKKEQSSNVAIFIFLILGDLSDYHKSLIGDESKIVHNELFI